MIVHHIHTDHFNRGENDALNAVLFQNKIEVTHEALK
jgi:hypothetical protein